LIEDGDVKAMTEMPNTRQASDLDRLKPAFEQLAQQVGISLSDCRALGISVTEMVNIETGTILPPLDKHKYLEGRRIDEIGAPMGLRTFADNDGRAALMGELAHGVGQGQEGKTVLLITLGTGIGVSATVNGDLLRGDHHGAGMLAMTARAAPAAISAAPRH
jgi:glucokinase